MIFRSRSVAFQRLKFPSSFLASRMWKCLMLGFALRAVSQSLLNFSHVGTVCTNAESNRILSEPVPFEPSQNAWYGSGSIITSSFLSRLALEYPQVSLLMPAPGPSSPESLDSASILLPLFLDCNQQLSQKRCAQG